MRLLRPVLTAVLLATVTSACSLPGFLSDPVETTHPDVAPRTVEAARAVATEEAARLTAGDWVGAWDLWTNTGKKVFSRSNFVKIHTECQTPTGGPYTIDDVRLDNATTAEVRMSALGVQSSYEVFYEDGQWRWQPNRSEVLDYMHGVGGLIARQRDAGNCK